MLRCELGSIWSRPFSAFPLLRFTPAASCGSRSPSSSMCHPLQRGEILFLPATCLPWPPELSPCWGAGAPGPSLAWLPAACSEASLGSLELALAELLPTQRLSNSTNQSFLLGRSAVKYLPAQHPPPLKFKLISVRDVCVSFKTVFTHAGPGSQFYDTNPLRGGLSFLCLFTSQRPRLQS